MAKLSDLSKLGFLSLKRIKLENKKDLAGVYALVDRKTFKVKYIGQSVRVLRRLKKHSLKKEHHVVVKPAFKDRVRIEKELILRFNPPLNNQYETLTDYKDLEEFKEWITQFQLSKNTVNIYIEVVALFLRSRYGKKINEELINRFVKEHPRKYVVSALKKFLKFKGLTLDVAKVKEPPRRPIEIPNWYKLKDNMKKIKNKEVVCVLKLLLVTGARISEILKLRLNDVDLKNDLLSLKTKGGKYREVTLPGDIAKEFKDYVMNIRETRGLLGNERIFFRGYKSIKNAYKTLRLSLDELNKEDKALFLKTHNFRRAMINMILEKTGGNVAIAKEFIGHENIEATMRYVSEAQKRKLVEEGYKALWGEK